MSLEGRTIVVALSGGIACYKAVEVVRLLTTAGASVRVVMTASAQQFITPLTLQTLSGHPVSTGTFDLTQESEIGHIRLADGADAIVIAPATANVLAKMAHGVADDLLTTILLATRAPVIIAPAMNVHMWEHVATQENVRRLLDRGIGMVGPAAGALACGYEGPGRLAEPAEIAEAVEAALTPQDLHGEHVLISAGPTREAMDPVRYLSNHSSGKMGYALARIARRRGATVTLVSGPTALPAPYGVRMVPVDSAAEMSRAIDQAFDFATVVVMAAAVADYRPLHAANRKLKKSAATLHVELERTKDILAGLGRRKARRIVVGFAAETHDVLAEARRKLLAKGADLIVANDVTVPGAGFGSDSNLVHLVDAKGAQALPLQAKDAVAGAILDWVSARRRARAAKRPIKRGAGPRARRRSPA